MRFLALIAGVAVVASIAAASAQTQTRGGRDGRSNVELTVAADALLAAPTAPLYTLTVAVSGRGTVVSSPRGIFCASLCHSRFTSGTVVRLTAHPQSGWKLAHWLNGCKGRASCSVKLTTGKSVRAVFSKSQSSSPPPPTTTTPAPAAPFTFTSSAFPTDSAIPAAFTCGTNNSPPLSWSGAPAGTVTFAIMLDDADSVPPYFTHWITYNIPPTSTGLAAGQSGPFTGYNDEDTQAYDGPCPPAGSGIHHYHFHLYALSSRLQYGTYRSDFLSQIAGITLDTVELIGIVDR